MLIGKILVLGLLAISAAGGAASTTTKYAGGAVETVSWGLKNAFAATEKVGWGVRKGGEYFENKFQDLNDYAKNCLRKEEYRNLTDTYNFQSQLVEGEWVLVNELK